MYELHSNGSDNATHIFTMYSSHLPILKEKSIKKKYSWGWEVGKIHTRSCNHTQTIQKTLQQLNSDEIDRITWICFSALKNPCIFFQITTFSISGGKERVEKKLGWYKMVCFLLEKNHTENRFFHISLHNSQLCRSICFLDNYIMYKDLTWIVVKHIFCNTWIEAVNWICMISFAFGQCDPSLKGELACAPLPPSKTHKQYISKGKKLQIRPSNTMSEACKLSRQMGRTLLASLPLW